MITPLHFSRQRQRQRRRHAATPAFAGLR